ncbi:MAG: hypothetical protein D3916_04865 [Candidatus Electrothrix sp. MAN1_4]|nr:hypothetical protein [Candidatus Electrothrix sp. MAN1_4]
MQKKSNQYFIQFLILASSLTLPCLSSGKSTKAVQQDLVWSQSDGLRHEIFTSSYQDNDWTRPVKITDNNANNLHPVLDIGTDGKKWLFWSAVRPDGISIEYAIFQGHEWSDPQKFPGEQHSSITPSVVADRNGGAWLVWAGNDGDNDDIYFSRYQTDKWSKPQVLHAQNEVPDIKPEIAYNEEGQIEVNWIGFRDNSYTKRISVYTEDTGWSAEQEKLENEEEQAQNQKEQETEIPSFLPADSQFFLKIY